MNASVAVALRSSEAIESESTVIHFEKASVNAFAVALQFCRIAMGSERAFGASVEFRNSS